MKKQDSGKHRMDYINRTVNRKLAGLSIVELMVALTLLEGYLTPTAIGGGMLALKQGSGFGVVGRWG